MIGFLIALAGGLLVLAILIDGFETVVLPRTVRRPWRFSNWWLRASWSLVRRIERIRTHHRRQTRLATWGALQIPLLVGFWASFLIIGFALIHHGVGNVADRTFGEQLYMSGVTFFTLGYGDVTPGNATGRLFAVIEAGIGYGFLALVLSFVPTLYMGFSRREAVMLRLDARAGSRPVGAEILGRYAKGDSCEDLVALFRDWEDFASVLLEGYLSFPVLGFYRSQHDEQSWLQSLTAVMDAAALVELGWEGEVPAWHPRVRFQARAFFAMGRHLLVDYAYLLKAEPRREVRFLDAGLVIAAVRLQGFALPDDEAARLRLRGLSELYEPFSAGLAEHIMLALPMWLPEPGRPDNWEISAWDGAIHR